MASRSEVYAAIDTERVYQDANYPQDGRPGAPNPLTIGEFILLLEEYTTRAREEWSKEKKPEYHALHFVRKVAGIAVNCMEQHGAPHRAPAAPESVQVGGSATGVPPKGVKTREEMEK